MQTKKVELNVEDMARVSQGLAKLLIFWTDNEHDSIPDREVREDLALALGLKEQIDRAISESAINGTKSLLTIETGIQKN